MKRLIYMSKTKTPVDIYEAFWDCMDNEQYPEAINIGLELVKINHHNYQAKIALAEAYELWNMPDEAIALYEECINLERTNDFAYYRYGNLLVNVYQDNETAEDYARKALYLKENAGYKQLLGVILLNLNRYDEALLYLKEAMDEFDEEYDEFRRSRYAQCLHEKALSLYYYDDNDEPFAIDPETPKEILSLLEEAKRVYPDAPRELYRAIAFAKNSMNKGIDTPKLWTLLIPAVLIYFSKSWAWIIWSAIASCVYLYFCIRPQWRLNRNKLFGEKTLFDYLTFGFYGVFVIIGTLLQEMSEYSLRYDAANNDKPRHRRMWS